MFQKRMNSELSVSARLTVLRHPSSVFLCLTLSLFIVGLFASCDGTEFKYSDYHCNLFIDNFKHQDATLASAMNPATKGIFCRITFERKSGAKYFVFENTNGDHSEKIFNGEDERLQSDRRIGMNNGLIVGFSKYDEVFLAYDNQCPKCFDYNALPLRNYPLTISSNDIAKCNNCKREFSLSIESNGLTRYGASTTGPFGQLNVY